MNSCKEERKLVMYEKYRENDIGKDLLEFLYHFMKKTGKMTRDEISRQIHELFLTFV